MIAKIIDQNMRAKTTSKAPSILPLSGLCARNDANNYIYMQFLFQAFTLTSMTEAIRAQTGVRAEL
jgi:hypothetical protein